MFSLRSTILLLILLVVPFILRVNTGGYVALEPFPAILLPSGAAKVPVSSDEITAGYTKIYIQNNDSTWNRVDTKELLHPIPVQYHDHIFSNNFGLSDEEQKDGRFIRLLRQLRIMKNRDSDEKEKESARKWLKNRIEEQYPNRGPLLKRVYVNERISLESGEVVEQNQINENIIHLDK